ncbi:MAG: bacteriohopanetetrol glucosamine biosynthesis glycosyltransferase HpnI [Candidatus Binataceae bacterium]
MTVVRIIAVIGVVVSVGYYLASLYAALRFARRASVPPPPLPKIAPRVAILKPLHGLDESLAANIMSFFEIAYPRLDYFFAVSSYEDGAAEVPAAMRTRYQFANTTLVIGEEPNCANRKIAKVIKMADRAEKANIFVMSDADISVDRDYLRRIVSELEADEKIGVVTCAYRARPSGSLASRIEALFVNADFAPQVMLSAAVEEMHHALGATVAIKRAALESMGGFRAVKDLLADDYYLGKFASDKGWKVRLSDALVTLTFEEKSLDAVWKRQLRWARTVRRVRPVSIGTIFCHAPFWALVLAAATDFSAASLAVLAGAVGIRIATSAIVIRRVLKLPELARDAWLVPLKDLMAAAIWLVSLSGNQVTWAGQRFRIERGGRMRPIAKTPVAPDPPPSSAVQPPRRIVS